MVEIFAYGELLKDDVLTEVLGRIPPRRPAHLPHHRRVLDRDLGFYVVLPDAEGAVEGQVLGGLTPSDLERLDAFEGVGEGLYVRGVRDVLVEGHSVAAHVYLRGSGGGAGGTL
jgi:gamma-glutamylcyclotransferase (GGCT)/AIG2-like uncharacterized protein YtfP